MHAPRKVMKSFKTLGSRIELLVSFPSFFPFLVSIFQNAKQWKLENPGFELETFLQIQESKLQ